jgi:ribonuclease I
MPTAFALDKNEESIEGARSGTYNYLVYAVTWQPTFCLINKNDESCKRYDAGFYTHGIWPYLKSTAQKNNRHPSYCTASPGCAQHQACPLEASVLSHLMNDSGFFHLVAAAPERLLQHEWQKHGTCYGKDQASYFNDFKEMRKAVKYNDAFNKAIGTTLPLIKLKSWFPPNAHFRCAIKDGHQYLFEVFYLIDNQGQPYTEESLLQIGSSCDQTAITIPRAN